LFGELNQSYELGFAVYHYFANGGKEAYINRVLASNAVKATSTVPYFPNGTGSASAALFTATAISAGTWGNGLTFEVSAGSVTATASVIPTFNLVIKLDGAEVERWNEVSVSPSDNRYLVAVLNNYSKFVTVTVPSISANALWAWYTVAATSGSGANGTAVADSDYVDALTKIDTVEGVLLLNAVGKTSNTVINAFLNKAETRGNSFVIIDPDASQTDHTTIGGTVVGSYNSSSYGAVDTMVYETHEIERVTEVAFRAAAFRKKRVTLADKANVLETSLLWRKVVKQVATKHPKIALDFIYADNAAMQLVRDPGRFDVLLCENLFGDMLSDQAAAVAGSLGMLPSASLGEGSFGLYEPAGGSAPDIAGKGVANPIAQILSLALLFEMSLDHADAAQSIRQAVAGAIQEGWRTADLAGPREKKVGTQEMAQEIARRVALGGGRS
jgi:hypothetical protein